MRGVNTIRLCPSALMEALQQYFDERARGLKATFVVTGVRFLDDKTVELELTERVEEQEKEGPQ